MDQWREEEGWLTEEHNQKLIILSEITQIFITMQLQQLQFVVS
jgi:hypothetical protein